MADDQPAPAPAPPAKGTTITIPAWAGRVAGPLAQAAVLIGAFFAYEHFRGRDGAAPAPAATLTDAAARKLGAAYAPDLAAGLGEGWDAAAAAIEGGKTVGEAQSALQDAFKAARTRAFTAKVAPDFARVLPEATEPRDQAHRREVAASWRAFARGLRGAR